ncbi:ribosomal protein L1 [Karstenula rhodostoma CBS 690.94]|uniref:Ribosomal protein L1 n=1 Tax=Karstenula rhodostoma CBS 690.94 TaxID=1392251 RepID=A0A9P4UED5_9PLEO|nr:ribosomal protein L1 [Karstenula rhodostoma CBS 690.94]
MAHPRSLLAPLGRITAPSIASARPSLPRLAALPLYQTSIRCKTTKAPDARKRKARKHYLQSDLRKADQFSLVDAMHYIRAFEVGRGATSSKYEMHVRFRTLKNGPSVRNRLRLPHPVKTDLRICVIAPPDSKAAADARAAGASLVGEEEIFAKIKEGQIEFDRCLCHMDSLQKMNKAALGRVLGPKGLMPSTKTGTVVTNVGAAVKSMVGASEYRERDAVVRLAVGQLGFTPEEMQTNIKAFMETLKKDIARLNGTPKEIHEVVLSSTNAPGFTLNGEFKGADSVSARVLSGPL